MASKRVMALLKKNKKLEDGPEKCYGHYKQSKKLKNGLKKRYGPSEKN